MRLEPSVLSKRCLRPSASSSLEIWLLSSPHEGNCSGKDGSFAFCAWVLLNLLGYLCTPDMSENCRYQKLKSITKTFHHFYVNFVSLNRCMHRELCSILCNNLNRKRIWKRIDICICITESLCYHNIVNQLYSNIKYKAKKNK